MQKTPMGPNDARTDEQMNDKKNKHNKNKLIKIIYTDDNSTAEKNKERHLWISVNLIPSSFVSLSKTHKRLSRLRKKTTSFAAGMPVSTWLVQLCRQVNSS